MAKIGKWRKVNTNDDIFVWANTNNSTFVEIEKPNHRHATYKFFVFYTNPQNNTTKILEEDEYNTIIESRERAMSYMKRLPFG